MENITSIEQLRDMLSQYPMSNEYKIAGNKDTINEVVAIDASKHAKDEDIVAFAYEQIQSLMQKHDGKQMYVRVLPEIGLVRDREGNLTGGKSLYTRLQFV